MESPRFRPMTRLEAGLAHPGLAMWLEGMRREGLAWGDQLPELLNEHPPNIWHDPAFANDLLGELERRGRIVRGRLDPHEGLAFILGMGHGRKQTPQGVLQRAAAFCMDLLCYAWHAPARKLALKRSRTAAATRGPFNATW